MSARGVLKQLGCITLPLKFVLTFGFVTVIIFIYLLVASVRQPSSDDVTWHNLNHHVTHNLTQSLFTSSFTFDFKFQDLNVSGVYSFRNVCVETITDAITHDKSHNKSHRIVVYNSIDGSSETIEEILATNTGRAARHLSNWTVHFTTDPIPKHHNLLPTSAFFVSPVYMYNPYHFWNDLYVRLFSVIKASNRLHVGMKNQILYSAEHPQIERSAFESSLRSLYTNEFYDVYYNLPTNTCYSSAVFGARNSLERFRDAVGHLLAALNISQPLGEDIKDSVVIIRRPNRRILNIDNLKEAAESMGFKSVKVVSFETMSLKEQLTVAANSRIMVGVQGGGLQWAIFMPPGSTLIEYSWPQKYWGPFYTSVQRYDIRYINVTVTDVRVNWKTFEVLTRYGRKCSKNEQLQLLNKTHEHYVDRGKYLETRGCIRGRRCIQANIKDIKECLNVDVME